MTDRETTDAAARRWVEAYERAWASNDEADIATLFEMDAEYRYDPWSEPERGLEEIVESWLKSRDEPDSYTFEWDVVGIDGDRAFVQGRTVYGPTADLGERTYRNLWVLDLSPDGRARSFTEWYMKEPAPAASVPPAVE
jgi:hypothetical protein